MVMMLEACTDDIEIRLPGGEGQCLAVIGSRLIRYLFEDPKSATPSSALRPVTIVCYLGLTIDHRLSWRPALASIRSDSRRSGGMASCIHASGRGCSPDIALRLFNTVASAGFFYAVTLVALQPAQWDVLDTLHRGVVRRLYRLPRSSPIGPTLAEAGETSLSLRARGSALHPIHSIYLTPEGRRLAEQLLDLPH
ncbi:hypothetical protein HPB51_017122 [Rhipicephalus microplus]|uniref:Uncharacterized protein n=1 Tax=Rhipicephalus microplus TaxID=6941 RepID=A0A9J6ENW7_RHIMP|nr:hypothetical protein HPB51_017122 [Rhipicephalus microplus]